MFPEISHIDDVLPHTKDKPEFIHVIKSEDGYQYIDYVFQDKNTFTHPIHLECRGIKFDLDGNLIARPFHKFFNLGEREDCRGIQDGHTIMHKLDGSMIHPMLVNGEVRLSTRKGLSDHAKFAEEIASTATIHMCRSYCEMGFTPLFELTTPKFRIVIPYPEHQLTLLAIRNTCTGVYLREDAVEAFAKKAGVPIVPYKELHPDVLLDHVRELKDEEGVVLRWDDGHMLKIKADDYVAMHRTKSVLDSEKGVKYVVLNNLLDDVLPLCDDYTRERLQEYATRVNEFISFTCAAVGLTVKLAESNNVDRKTFALEYVSNVNIPIAKSLAFQVFQTDKNIQTTLLEMLRKNPSKLPIKWEP